jgi:hypothetical protein
LYNAVTETEFDRDISPAGTQWALGTADNIGSLQFDTFRSTLDNSIGSNIVGTDMVVFLEQDGIYVEIKFTSWTRNADGGGFTFIRGIGPDEDPFTGSLFATNSGQAATFTESPEFGSSASLQSGSLSHTDSVTVELWVKPAATDSEVTFLSLGSSEGGFGEGPPCCFGPESNDNNLGPVVQEEGPPGEGSSGDLLTIGIDSDGNFTAGINDDDADSSVTLTAITSAMQDQWYHIAVTGKNNDQVKLYINGFLHNSSAIGTLGLSVAGESGITIGTGEGGEGGGEGPPCCFGPEYNGNNPGPIEIQDGPPSSGFLGDIDELRVWSDDRSAAEIRSSIYVPPSGLPSNLTAYWQFNEHGDDGPFNLDEIGALELGPVELANSDVPLGSGEITFAEAFQSGSVTVGNASLTMSDGFDNPVDVLVSEISTDPNNYPSGYSSSLGGSYFVIDVFGDPGTFSADLTLAFGAGVISSAQESTPSSVKLFKRESTSSGEWADLGGASSAVSATGVVTWSGITSFSQFIAVGEENLIPPPTIWNTMIDSLVFTRNDDVDPTSTANQDCITSSVCITRDNEGGGIYNALSESSFSGNSSPSGTQWALGTTDSLESLQFNAFRSTLDNEIGNNIVDTDMVLYLEADEIYVDIRFTSWTSGGSGGGFSYVRGLADNSFRIDRADSSDVIVYNDSTYNFTSNFFSLPSIYLDSTLSIYPTSTPSGTLYLDVNDNGAFDNGTDSELVSGQSFNYTPNTSGLKFESSGLGIETITLGLSSSTTADTVTFNFATVEATPTFTNNSDSSSWYMITNPMDTPIGTLLENVWTQGAVNADASGGSPNLYVFNQDSAEFEAITTDLDTTKLSAGEGLLAYFFWDNDYTDGTPPVGGGWPKTLTNYGNPFSTDAITVNLKNNDKDNSGTTNGNEGWALMGNPYGWYVRVDSVLATIQRDDPTASNFIYVWDSVNKEYTVSGTGGIAPYQSFFVRLVTSGATSNVALSYDDYYDNSVQAKSVDVSAVDGLRFTLNKKGSEYSSDSYITFKEEGSSGIDKYDGYHLQSLANKYAHLFTEIDELELIINNLPLDMSEKMEYPLYLDSNIEGDFELKWDSESIPEGWIIKIKDVTSGITYDLNEVQQIDFKHILRRKEALQADELRNVTRINADSNEPKFIITVIPAIAVSNENDLGIPTVLELEQNYPNPFNPSSIIRFGVPTTSEVHLEVFDILGRRVAVLLDNEVRQPGRYNIRFDGRNLASGMYIYRLVVGSKVLTKKMTLIK